MNKNPLITTIMIVVSIIAFGYFTNVGAAISLFVFIWGNNREQNQLLNIRERK